MTNATMLHPRVPAQSPELDLLRRVAVRVPCPQCAGHYGVTLRQILLAQQLVHQGCPARHEPECPPVIYAGLADKDALEEFSECWWRLVDRVQSAGFEVSL